jgi:hypothetical protein
MRGTVALSVSVPPTGKRLSCLRRTASHRTENRPKTRQQPRGETSRNSHVTNVTARTANGSTMLLDNSNQNGNMD